jgi:hypothetical protein
MSIGRLKKIILNEHESNVSFPTSELQNLIQGFNQQTVQAQDIVNYLLKGVNKVNLENLEKEQTKNNDYSQFQTIRGEGKQLIVNALKRSGYDPDNNSTASAIVKQFVHNYEGDVAEALGNLDNIFPHNSEGYKIVQELKPRMAPHKWRASREG